LCCCGITEVFGNPNDSLPKPIALFDSTQHITFANEKPDFDFENKIKLLLKDTAKWKRISEINIDTFKRYNEVYLIQKLPKLVYQNPALLISFYGRGFQIFIDDKQIYSCGNLGKDTAFRFFNSVLLPIDTSQSPKYLVLRMHFDKLLQIGGISNIMIGSSVDLSKILIDTQYNQLTANLHENIAAFIQIIIGIISFIIFFIRWKAKEYIFLFFSIFAISSGVSNGIEFSIQFHNISLSTLYYFDIVSTFLIPLGFLGFIKYITKSPKKSLLNYALWSSLVNVAGCLFIPLEWSWDYFYWGLVAIYISIAIRAMFLVKIHRDKSFRLPLIAIFVLFVSIIHDCLLLYELPSLPFGLYNWATLLLILAFGVYIEKNYRYVSNKVKDYSFELEKTKNYLLALEKENLLTQYQVLKNQVNPHFLFNSLNTLSWLIRNKQEDAVRFVEEFADLFRYVLDVHHQFVIELSKELDFIQSYIYLQKIRYGNNLSVNINVPAENLKDLVMPLTLQILIENAIKHNEISDKYPLEVKVNINGNYIFVSNILRYVESPYSKGIGLKNLKERYAGITDIVPEFYIDNGSYIAKIPIIKGE